MHFIFLLALLTHNMRVSIDGLNYALHHVTMFFLLRTFNIFSLCNFLLNVYFIIYHIYWTVQMFCVVLLI